MTKDEIKNLEHTDPNTNERWDQTIDPVLPPGVNKKFEIKTDNEITFTVNPDISEKTATGSVAKQVAEMMYKGATKDQALKVLGVEDHQVDLTELVRQTNMFLVKTYAFPDEARRQIVKAALNKVLTEAVADNDHEMIIKASKEIASDPDVGLKAPPQNVINISLDKVQDALNKADSIIDLNFEE